MAARNSGRAIYYDAQSAFIKNVNFGRHISLTLHCIETQWRSRLISNRPNKFCRAIPLFSMLSFADTHDLCRGDSLRMCMSTAQTKALITDNLDNRSLLQHQIIPENNIIEILYKKKFFTKTSFLTLLI